MKIVASLFLLLGTAVIHAQSAGRADLIALGTAYSANMFTGKPTKNTVKLLKSEKGDLMHASKFVAEAVSQKNRLLTPTFLSLPDETVMKQLFIVFAIHGNNHADNPRPTEQLVDSLVGATIGRYELIENYYNMLFIACGNKNRPFDLAKVDFELDTYQLRDETEKAIFFLTCMDYCGTVIWGYINIVDPPNTAEALQFINRYPRFDGEPYYTYNKFFFPDFEMVFYTADGLESFKRHYLNKYYSTLLSHVLCLIDQKVPDEQVREVMMESILSDDRLWQYTELRETLEQIFKKKE